MNIQMSGFTCTHGVNIKHCKVCNRPIKNFKLNSDLMVYTPNVIRFITNMAKIDRSNALSIAVVGWPELTKVAYSNILDGNYTIEDDYVLVEG